METNGMIDAQKRYEAAKRALADAEELVARIGRKSASGGVGVINSISVTMEVCHQDYHGATNYHSINAALAAAMAEAVKRDSKRLLAEGLASMRADVRDRASEFFALLEKVRLDSIEPRP